MAYPTEKKVLKLTSSLPYKLNDSFIPDTYAWVVAVWSISFKIPAMKVHVNSKQSSLKRRTFSGFLKYGI